MEESLIIETVTIFLRSCEIDEIKLDLYSPTDEFITSFLIKNYTQATMTVQRQLSHFYCVVTSPTQAGEEQFEVKVQDWNNEDQIFEILKHFSSFSLKLEISINRIIKNAPTSRVCQKVNTDIENLASEHLNKIRRKVFKRLQVQQLRKPLPGKKQNPTKSNNIRKINTNNNLATSKMRVTLGDRFYDSNPGTLHTLKTLGKFKITDQSENEDEQKHQGGNFALKIKKYNTLCENIQLPSQNPSKDNSKQHIYWPQQKLEMPVYEEIYRTLQPSFSQKPRKHCKVTHKAYLSSLQSQTWQQLEKQKLALGYMHRLVRHDSQQHSAVSSPKTTVHTHYRQHSSPYSLSHSQLLKRRKAK